MLSKERNLEELKLDIESISPNSHKRIIVKCDYCQNEYSPTMKNRTSSYQNFPKDCCKKCKFRKREEVSLYKYGVKNSAQRPEVKEKIKETNKDWINSEEFNRRRSETMMKKYGTDNVMKSKEIKNKIQNTLLDKYGVENPIQIPGVAQAASKKAIQTRIERGLISTIDGITLPQKAKEKGKW